MTDGDDPYRPPDATVEMAPTPSTGPLRYAGFWRRFGALWLDGMAYSPITVLVILLGMATRLAPLYWFVPGAVIGVLFHVYLVRRFGGTPGKLMLGMRIAMVGGAPVTTKAAWLRHGVQMVLTLANSLAIVLATLALTDAEFRSLGYLPRMQRLVELAPAWRTPMVWLASLWVWGEFVTMMFNPQRRAVQDLMAGTVVVMRDAGNAVEQEIEPHH